MKHMLFFKTFVAGFVLFGAAKEKAADIFGADAARKEREMGAKRTKKAASKQRRSS